MENGPAARVAVGAVAADDGRVGGGREPRDAAKERLRQAAPRVQVAVGGLQVLLDGVERVGAGLDKLKDVVGLRVGGARQLARCLCVLKIVRRVRNPTGEAAERVADGRRRRVDVEKHVARRVRHLAVRQLLHAPRVVADVGVALAQHVGEAVRLGGVGLPVELQEPVGRRRRDRDAVAKALVETPALVHELLHVVKEAVDVLGARLRRRGGGRLGLPRRKPPERVGDGAAALHDAP